MKRLSKNFHYTIDAGRGREGSFAGNKNKGSKKVDADIEESDKDASNNNDNNLNNGAGVIDGFFPPLGGKGSGAKATSNITIGSAKEDRITGINLLGGTDGNGMMGGFDGGISGGMGR